MALPRRLAESDFLPNVVCDCVSGGYQGVDESEEDCGDSAAVQALARRLEDVLRAAKSAQLDCGGVLLPADLLPRIARDVLRMAENEPCGLK